MKKQLLTSVILLLSLSQVRSQFCMLPPSSDPVPVSVGTGARAVAYGLFDGDSYIDLIAADYGSNTISLLSGSAAGTFSNVASFAVSASSVSYPSAIAVGHFDADATLDVAVVNNLTNDVAILFGTGTGSFSAATNYPVGNAPNDIARGDFNQDGRVDLAVCNGNDNSVLILYGSVGGTFTPSGPYSTGNIPYGVIAVDLNHDSNLDLVTANYASNNISVFLGSASGTFSTAVNYSVSAQPELHLAAADLNGDTHPDLVISHNGTNKVSVMLGPGDGTFPASVDYNTGAGPRGVAIADFNNDTFMDLCVLNGSSGSLDIFDGNGSGTFSTGHNFSTNSSTPWGVLVQDLDADSKPDIAVANTGSGDVTILLNSPLPTVYATATSTGVCVGGSVTLYGCCTSYYTWSHGVFDATSFNPVTTETYTLTGSNLNGCSNTATITVQVSNHPPVAANASPTVVCSGAEVMLTGSGAATYTWSTGSTVVNTSTASVTPTTSSTYTLTGDINGCSDSVTVSVAVHPPKNITGNITSVAGSLNGNVELYRYKATLSQWQLVNTTPFSNSYTFNAVDSGNYVVKAIPTATYVQSTYGSSGISWKDATVINHGCTSNTSQAIDIIPFISIGVGTGFLSGVVTETVGFGQKPNNPSAPLVPGNPIGGIIVKGGKNPGGLMFTQTVTDGTGGYTLTALPDNLPGEEYFILVDMAGLDTNLTYHRVLTSGNNQISGLNFTVDSIYINPIPFGSPTGLNNVSTIENNINAFPNPASQNFTINYKLSKTSLVKIELCDVVGRSVKEILPSSWMSENTYRHEVITEDLKPGIYFIKTKINEREGLTKLLITR
jgi:hypothetical protein